VTIALAASTLASCTSDSERVQNFVAQGRAYVEEGRDQEAIIEFRNVLQVAPDDPVAHEELSLAYLRLGRARDAYWEMSETVRVAPDNLEARLLYGTVAATAGDDETAVEQANAALSIDPAEARAYVIRARAMELNGDLERAHTDLREAISITPAAPAFHLLLGAHLERRGLYGEAEGAYRRLLEVEPSFVAVSALFGIVARDPARHDEADRLVARLLELARDAPERLLEFESPGRGGGTTSLVGRVARDDAIHDAHLLKAMRLRDTGDLDGAIGVLEAGIEHTKRKVDLIYRMASFYREAGRREDEARAIGRATEVAPDDANAHVLHSTYLQANGELADAVIAAESALALAPDDPGARLQVAHVMVDVGYRDADVAAIQRANEIVDSLVREAPGNADVHLSRAKISLAEDDLSRAREALNAALQLRPGWAEARFLLGSTLAAAGDLTRARVELEAAAAGDGGVAGVTGARRLLAATYARLGEHRLSIEQGRRHLELHAEDWDVVLLVAQGLERIGRVDEARDALRTIPEAHRTSGMHLGLARIALLDGRIDEAAQHLERAEALSPDDPLVLRGLLAVDRGRDRVQESVARIDLALAKRPDDARLVGLRAEALLYAGDHRAALAELERAVALDPANEAAQVALADLVIASGDLGDMTEVVEAAVGAVPRSSDLHYRLAQIYDLQDRDDLAIEAYGRAIALNGNLAVAKNNLAYLLVASDGDLDRALELAQEAKAQLPDDPFAADTLGMVMLARGVPEAAIAYFEEAIARLPADAYMLRGTVHEHLAEAYEHSGQIEQAVGASRAALEIAARMEEGATRPAKGSPTAKWVSAVRDRINRLTDAR